MHTHFSTTRFVVSHRAPPFTPLDKVASRASKVYCTLEQNTVQSTAAVGVDCTVCGIHTYCGAHIRYTLNSIGESTVGNRYCVCATRRMVSQNALTIDILKVSAGVQYKASLSKFTPPDDPQRHSNGLHI